MRANVVFRGDAGLRELGGGVSRSILAHNGKMMIVEVRFEAGAVGALHAHPHVQSTYVLGGRFRFTIDGEPVEVGAGDTIAFAENVPHGTECLEAGALIDVFSPMREDFL